MSIRNQLSQPLHGSFRPMSPPRTQTKINFNANPFPFNASPPRQLSPQMINIHQHLVKNSSSKLIYFDPQKQLANQFKPLQIQKTDSRTHIRVPASYNRDNIYYNRPGNRSQNSSSSNSLSLKKANIKALHVFNRQGFLHQNPLIQPPSYPYPQSAQNLRPISPHHRSISPPTMSPTFSASNRPFMDLNLMAKMSILQNSINSVFTFGQQPRVPSVLRERKPRKVRLNSANSEQGIAQDQSNQYINKQKSTQTVSIYHRKSPCVGGPKNQDKAIVYNINIIAPKVLVKHTKNMDNQISEDVSANVKNNQFNIYNSYDINAMSPVNRTPTKENDRPNNSQKVDIYRMGQNTINERMQSNQLYESKSGTDGMKKEHEGNQSTENIANNLMHQLQLNYDYFSKHQYSDRSISDHVLT